MLCATSLLIILQELGRVIKQKIKMKYISPFYIGIPNLVLLVLAFIFPYKELFSNFILKIIGIILILSVFVLESISHRQHKQAHDKAGEINRLVTNGIYSKIRHPIYLGWIFLNIGGFLLIQNLTSLFISIIFTFFWYLEAKSEEKFMNKKFKKYKKYKQKTEMFFPRLN